MDTKYCLGVVSGECIFLANQLRCKYGGFQQEIFLTGSASHKEWVVWEKKQLMGFN